MLNYSNLYNALDYKTVRRTVRYFIAYERTRKLYSLKRDRQTDRQTDRDGEGGRERERQRQRERERQRETDKQRDKERQRQTDRRTDRDRQTWRKRELIQFWLEHCTVIMHKVTVIIYNSFCVHCTKKSQYTDLRLAPREN